jgi:hypothetical protein
VAEASGGARAGVRSEALLFGLQAGVGAGLVVFVLARGNRRQGGAL